MKIKNDGTLIVISGPSGVGKNTVCDELLVRNKDLYLSVSMTSRGKRPNEIDKKDYYFVTREEFEDNISRNNFLEYAKVHDEYYGTPKSEVLNRINDGIDVILTIDVQGALNIKKMYPNSILIFLLPPSMEVLRERLVNRKTETMEKIISRLSTAYNEIDLIDKYDYFIVNDKSIDAAEKIEAILIAEKCNINRIESLDLKDKEELIQELMN